MIFQHGLFGLSDQIGKAELCFALNNGCILGNRHFEPDGREHRGVHIPPVTRYSTHAHKTPDLADQRFGKKANSSVGNDRQIKRAASQGGVYGFSEMRITVNMFNLRRNLGNLVRSTMKNRDLIAPLNQAIHNKRSGRSGASDNQCFHSAPFPLRTPDRIDSLSSRP